MIDLHFTSGPNGRKVAIMLEELGLPYRLIQHNIGKGDLLTEEFRKLNPNGRVPVLVDDEPIGGGTDPITSHGHRKRDAQRIRDLVERYQAQSR